MAHVVDEIGEDLESEVVVVSAVSCHCKKSEVGCCDSAAVVSTCWGPVHLATWDVT